jgi:hypothetical protein
VNDGHRPEGPDYQPGPHVHVCALVTNPGQHTGASCVCSCGARFTPSTSRTVTA